jgi:hypothetical protein
MGTDQTVLQYLASFLRLKRFTHLVDLEQCHRTCSCFFVSNKATFHQNQGYSSQALMGREKEWRNWYPS